MRASRVVAVVAGALAALALGSCGAARLFADARARQFEAACDAARGRTYANQLEPFDGFQYTRFQSGTTDAVSYRYSPSRSVHCSLELGGGHVASVQASRTSDYDRCSDPLSYPRRHWVCGAARVIVP